MFAMGCLLLSASACSSSSGHETSPTIQAPDTARAESSSARCTDHLASVTAQFVDSQDVMVLINEWGASSVAYQEALRMSSYVLTEQYTRGAKAAATKLRELSSAACHRATMANAVLALQPGDSGYMSADLP